MTRSTAQLRRLRPVGPGSAPDPAPAVTAPELRSVLGTGPDDGRLAHPATHGRGPAVRSRHQAERGVLGFVHELLDAPRSAVGRLAPGLSAAAVVVLRGARDARPGLRYASVVLPASAHPAWYAAAATVGLVPVVVPVDGEGRAEVAALATAIREDTVLVLASAPTFTHGTIDPVAWIAAATQARGVPLHVDAADGGWAMAYAGWEGRIRPPWDFACPGVSSITLDVGPDGAAPDLTAVLFRTAAAARTATTEPGRGPSALPGAWATPGTALADAARTLAELGHEGCAELAADAVAATAALAAATVDLPGVILAARPDATTVVLRTDATCDPFTLADALIGRGWSAEPVLPETGPALLRVAVTAAMHPHLDRLVADLDAALGESRGQGRAQVDPTLARLLETIDPGQAEGFEEYTAGLLLDAATVLDDAGGPTRRATTHLLLAAAEPGVRRRLLASYRHRLARPDVAELEPRRAVVAGEDIVAGE